MKYTVFILVLLLFPLNIVWGQESLFDQNTGLPVGIIEQFSVDINPEVPSPGELVSITTESYSTNFDAAYFTWKINGEVNQEGKGLKNFSFYAPGSGQTTIISVTIQKEEGGIINRSFTFSPADVDIIYEAETYTPPYYKGKPLFTSESELRFVAMPHFVEKGSAYNPKKLIYNWSINGSVSAENSGFGKQILYAKGNLVQRPFSVSVEVSSPNSNLKAKDSVYIDDVDPELVIYEDNPLLGVVFEKAIQGNFLLQRPEVVFQAVPYYFSTTQKDASFLDYKWKMNGQEINAGSETSSIRFRNDTGEAGHSIISLDVEHFKNILQVAQDSIDLTFEAHDAVLENDFNF